MNNDPCGYVTLAIFISLGYFMLLFMLLMM